MRIAIILAVILAFSTGIVSAGKINGDRWITGYWDAGGADWSKPVPVVASDPPTCAVGEVIWSTAVSAGENLRGCTSTNFWSPLGGTGSGSGSVTTIKEGGVQVGDADIVTIDFDGDDFDLNEDPNTEINVTIASGAMDAEYIELGDAFVGDVTGTYDATVVGNDSHDHTSSTITLASTNLTDTADILYESELSDLDDLSTQIGTTGTADETTFLRGDNSWQTVSGGSGETNTASNLGGGLANYSTKVGVDLRFNSFNATDFDLGSNLLSIDDTTWVSESDLSAFTGSSNIVTLGTIATGTWQGTAIADAYIPDSITVNNATTAATATAVGDDAVGAMSDIAAGIKTADTADKIAVFTGTLPGGTAECVEVTSAGLMQKTGSACGGSGGGNTTSTQATEPTCNIGDTWIESDADYIQWNAIPDANGDCEWWVDFASNGYITKEGLSSNGIFQYSTYTVGGKGNHQAGGRLYRRFSSVSATTGSDAYLTYSNTSSTTQTYFDAERFIEARYGGMNGISTTWRMYFGTIITDTNQDFLTIDHGIYWWCATLDDLDGDGTAGSANDLTWWAITSDGDTDDTGDLCASGGYNATTKTCDSYTAVNTTATNSEISCDSDYEHVNLMIRQVPDGSEVRFYAENALVATHTTNIPAGDLYTMVTAGSENGAAVTSYTYIQYLTVTINPF
jgi:hypothetical protein